MENVNPRAWLFLWKSIIFSGSGESTSNGSRKMQGNLGKSPYDQHG